MYIKVTKLWINSAPVHVFCQHTCTETHKYCYILRQLKLFLKYD